MFPANNFVTGMIWGWLVVAFLGGWRWMSVKVKVFFRKDSPHLDTRPSAYELMLGCCQMPFFIIFVLLPEFIMIIWIPIFIFFSG